jgi:uncharacterized iron-regulated membrane protein
MRLPLRTVIFWCHLATGLVAGSIVALMSATGVLLMYEQQIVEWADRELRAVQPSSGAVRLSVERLLGEAVAAHPGARPSSLTLYSDPASAAVVSLGREQTLYVDPTTGRVLGEGSRKVRAAFHAITDWHRWLGADGAGRETARAITGVCNVAFLFLILSGFYLWVPRTWTRRQVRNVAWFRGGLSGKARDFNWHNTIGLWVFLPLFVIVLSAVSLSYPGPRRPEGPGGPPRGGESRPENRENAIDLGGLDALWVQAEQRVADWQSISLRLPSSPDAPVSFTILRGDRSRPDLRAQLTLDRATGDVVTWQPYASQSFGRKARAWMRWLHTGEAGGWLGQTIAGIASAGATVLVWTGAALSWRRFVSRKKSTVERTLNAPADFSEGSR